jgi:hypothetical protein
MANMNRTKKAGNDVAVVAALRSGVLGLDQLPLAGKLYTQSEAADLVQSRIDAGNALQKAKAEWIAAIGAFEAIDAHVGTALRDLRNVVIGYCGEDSPKMADFRFAPRKRRVFTQEQITAIVLKRNATRKRNGTMGRKQKKAVKGVVPVAAAAAEPVVVTAAAAGVSAAAPAVAPAGVASPAVLVALGGAAVAAAPGVGAQTEAQTQAQTEAQTEAGVQGVAAEGSGGAVTPSPTGERGSTTG